MATNYVFSLQPTFTQGLILGQISILSLLYVVLKYLFLDSAHQPSERLAYHPHVDTEQSAAKVVSALHPHSTQTEPESALWLNLLLSQV